MKMKYISALLAVALTALSCEPSHVNDNLTEPHVYIVNHGLQQVTFYEVETLCDYDIYAYCSGYYGADTKVTLGVDTDILNAYNAASNTDYKLLDAKYYTLLTPEGSITAEGRRATMQVQLDCRALAADLPTDMSNYVIPLSLTSTSVATSDEIKYILVKPNMLPAMAEVEKPGTEEVVLGKQKGDLLEYSLRVYTQFDNRWECNLQFAKGQEVLDAYNAQHGTTLLSLPDNAYTIEAIDKLPAGQNAVDVKITVDRSKIPTDNIYSLAVALKDAGIFQIDSNADKRVKIWTIIPLADRSAWTLVEANSWENDPPHNDIFPPNNMIDGNLSTMWINRWGNYGEGVKSQLPYFITWNMNADVPVYGFYFVRRIDNYRGDTRGGYCEVSMDGQTWTTVFNYDFGTATRDAAYAGPFYFFDLHENPVTARYVRLWVTMSNRGDQAGYSEFGVLSY